MLGRIYEYLQTKLHVCSFEKVAISNKIEPVPIDEVPGDNPQEKYEKYMALQKTVDEDCPIILEKCKCGLFRKAVCRRVDTIVHGEHPFKKYKPNKSKNLYLFSYMDGHELPTDVIGRQRYWVKIMPGWNYYGYFIKSDFDYGAAIRVYDLCKSEQYDVSKIDQELWVAAGGEVPNLDELYVPE